MKHRVVICQCCGQRNRLPAETWSAKCGHCDKSLAISGATEKMLRAYAPKIITGIGAVAMLGLFISGVVEMLPGSSLNSDTDQPGLQQSLADMD